MSRHTESALVLRFGAFAILLVAIIALADKALPQVFASAKGCVAWLAVGGFGHIIFDVLTYAAVFFLGTKIGTRRCKH